MYELTPIPTIPTRLCHWEVCGAGITWVRLSPPECSIQLTKSYLINDVTSPFSLTT